MRKIRTALSVLLILLLLCTSVGCAPQEQQAIYMVTDGQEGYYWENMILGATAAVHDAGWEIQVVPWEDEPDMKAHINAAREIGAGYIVTAFSDERSRANEMMFLDADAPQLIVLGKDTGETWAATRMVFDESQKECNSEIWIDVYNIVRLLSEHRSSVRKDSNGWGRVYPYKDLDVEELNHLPGAKYEQIAIAK